VNTHDGPQNTSSSNTTPAYSDTLFCTLQFRPIFTPEAIKTFCPKLHF